ncbi:MAG TPA: ATP-binding protein [Ilumatobacteraceae bacterium]
MTQLYRQVLRTGDDVFAARQRGRLVAALAGFDEADQVRIATALSEVGRDVLAGTVAPSAGFEIAVVDDDLVVTVSGFHDTLAADGDGAQAARRLMTSVGVEATDRGDARVVMQRRLPKPLTGAAVDHVRVQVTTHGISTPLEELRSQNSELVTALDSLSARQQELVQLNEELEETNRGVMAMYSQLSDELDSTNRGVVALYADLDDKSRQIQAANEAKSRFLSSVSHELRSPVTGIIGLARLLLEAAEERADDTGREQLRLVLASSTELLDLVSQLLDLAKAEAGRLDPQFLEADLRPLVDDVVNAIRPAAHDGVTIDVEFDDRPLVASVDVTLFKQVVRNVLSNALAFTERGAVRISGEQHGGRIVIAIADSGIGIAAEHLELIFDEFFQVRSSMQIGRRGTGLGLPYSRKVMEALGGTLTASSEIGAGSTFTMTLPATDLGTAVATDAARILVVDDDETFRRLVVGWLTPIAAVVAEAADGHRALQRLRTAAVDAVVLDLVMQPISGAEVLNTMATEDGLRYIPVIVVTSRDINAALRVDLAHASMVLAKSELSEDTLRRAVRAVIDGAR